MESRYCPRCKVTKPVAEFYESKGGRLTPYCRPCFRAYTSEHRKPRTPEQLARMRETARQRGVEVRGGESSKALQPRRLTQGLWRCPRCETTKPLDEFYLGRDGKPRTYCKDCWSAYSAEWKRQNPAHRAKAKAWRERPEVAQRLRDNYIRRQFGLTVDEYHALWDLHGGLCHICREPFPPTARNTQGRALLAVCVDHDHETGRVRGLLCAPCNRGLGHFRDDPKRLRAAADYLG